MSGAYFVTLPARVFFDRQLGASHLRVLGIIASHQTAQSGWSYFTQRELAQEYNPDRPPTQQAISKIIRHLLALGYIRVKACRDELGQKAANGYSVVADVAVEDPEQADLDAAKPLHAADCYCKVCRIDLYDFPMTKGHVRGCNCARCREARRKRVTVRE